MSYNPLSEFTPDQLRAELERRQVDPEPEADSTDPETGSTGPFNPAFTITNLDAAKSSQRTGWADTIEAAFEVASDLAITFSADVLITDGDGPVARIAWAEK
ncbi:MAG: hypothetical protein ABWZ30_01000 [Jiangellaceae bacterium]